MDHFDVLTNIISYLPLVEKKELRLVNRLFDEVILGDFRRQKSLTFRLHDGYAYKEGLTMITLKYSLSTVQQTGALNRILVKFPNIRSVKVEKVPILNHFIKSFSRNLKFLRKLAFFGGLSKRDAILIGKVLKWVEEIDICDPKCDEEDLEPIYENLKIKKLSLDGVEVLKAYNFELLNCLEDIKIRNADLFGKSTVNVVIIASKLVETVKPHQLTKIDLDFLRSEDKDLRSSLELLLGHFTNLEYFKFHSYAAQMSPGLCEKISKLLNLKYLSLLLCWIPYVLDVSDDFFCLKMVKNLSKLEYLSIPYNIFQNKSSLSIEECCPNIKVIKILNLWKEDVIPMSSLRSVMKLKKLKKFVVRFIQPSEWMEEAKIFVPTEIPSNFHHFFEMNISREHVLIIVSKLRYRDL